MPVLALVDLYAAELVDPGGPAPDAPRRLRAPLTLVHPDLYPRRPGLRLLQAAWHPAAAGHFAALASDGVWRLYNSADPTEPEQSFALKFPGGGRRGGGGLGLGAAGSRGAAPRAAAFAWGPAGGGGGWGHLAVLVLASDGGVYCLCPVAPFGLRVAAGALRRLLASCDGPAAAAGGSTARAWLQAAFPGVVHPAGEILAAGEGFAVAPHLLETAVQALQGPLNAGAESAHAGRGGGSSGAAPAPAVALAVSARSASSRPGGRRLFDDGAADGYGDDYYRPGDAEDDYEGAGAGDGGVTCCAVVTGLSDGRLYAHALDGGALVPMWTDGLPQCAYSARMDVAAVRCDCAVVAAAGGGAGGGGPEGTASMAGGWGLE